MTLLKIILLVSFAYLLGSIPFAYLLARLVKGIDIRRYGSGTVSGSMVYEHVNRWVVVPVGLLDIAKAALPVCLGLRFGLGEGSAAAAGLAALIGHNWPVYLGFTGGRGISPLLGMLLVLFPWGDAWLLGFLAIGYLLKDSAPFALAGIASLPILILLLDGPRVLVWFVLLALLVILIKRLEANRRPLPGGRESWRILWMRLVFDRDMMDHNAWIHRRL